MIAKIPTMSEAFWEWLLPKSDGDPVTLGWPAVSNIRQPLFTIGIYLLCVYLSLGRKKTATERLYLKNVLIIYNIFQVLFSFYIFKETIYVASTLKYNLICQPPHSTGEALGRRMAVASWLFHVSKYIDLLDTIFFILKGNWHQVSFLHVFHHSSMIFNSWLGVRYAPTGHSFFIHLANSFVHILMYSYYFLSSLGSWMKPYLWWKKYLTQIQIIQFLLMALHMLVGAVNGCPVPGFLVLTVLLYLLVLVTLFVRFYINSYSKKGKEKIK